MLSNKSLRCALLLASSCWAADGRHIEVTSDTLQRSAQKDSLASVLLAAHAATSHPSRTKSRRSHTMRSVPLMRDSFDPEMSASKSNSVTEIQTGTDIDTSQMKGVFVPTQSMPKESTPAEIDVRSDSGDEKKHMGIKELLTEYGLIALGFHFSVWVTCLTLTYALLTFGLDLSALFAMLGQDSAQGAGVAGRVAATLGLVEVIGPARLALTVAATPKVSGWARQYKAIRDLEQFVQDKWDELNPKTSP